MTDVVVDENVMVVRSLYMNNVGCQDLKIELRYISEHSLLAYMVLVQVTGVLLKVQPCT